MLYDYQISVNPLPEFDYSCHKIDMGATNGFSKASGKSVYTPQVAIENLFIAPML